jgi:large subunit ribosomal protein L35
MPSVKLKTHKGIKKRFKVTANGKVTHKKCGSSHLNSHKSGKQIRRLRKKQVIQNRKLAVKYGLAMLKPLPRRPSEPGQADMLDIDVEALEALVGEYVADDQAPAPAQD